MIGSLRNPLQNGIQNLRDAVSVHADHLRILSHGFGREIPVRDDKHIAVPHLAQNLQKLRREQTGNAFEHGNSSFLKFNSDDSIIPKRGDLSTFGKACGICGTFVRALASIELR